MIRWPHTTEPGTIEPRKQGFRRWAAPEFRKYLKVGFHPNDIDKSELIKGWADNYPEVAALQVG